MARIRATMRASSAVVVVSVPLASCMGGECLAVQLYRSSVAALISFEGFRRPGVSLPAV